MRETTMDEMLMKLGAAQTALRDIYPYLVQKSAELRHKEETLEVEYKKLQDGFKRLQREREAFEREAAMTIELNSQNSDMVHLNVGGTPFTTSRTTLCRSPSSMLTAWFSGRHKIRMDVEGRVIIDRDPHLFRYILEYLRNGCRMLVVPEERELRQKLHIEFDFFCLPFPGESLVVNMNIHGVSMNIMNGHSDSATTVCVTDALVVSGSADRTIKIWDIQTGRCVEILDGHENTVTALEATNNGQILASGSLDCTVRTWDLKSGASIGIYSGHEGPVWAVAISESGKFVASLGADMTLRTWDVNSGKELVKITNGNDLQSFTFCGDCVLGAVGETVNKWDARTGACLQTWQGHTAKITRVGMIGEEIVYAIAENGQVKMWNVTSGHPLGSFLVPACARYVPSLVCDGWACNISGGKADIYDISSKLSAKLNVPAGVSAVAMGGNVRAVAVACADGRVVVWTAREDVKKLEEEAAVAVW